MNVRRLSAGDWAAFRDIRLAMLRSDPHAFGATLAEWQDKPEAEIRDWLMRLRGFGAVEGNLCLACAAWSALPGRVAGHRGHVMAVYTRPEARVRGLFRAVMEAVEADARTMGIRQLELDVAVGNHAARAAYAALGYVEVAVLPDALCHDGVYSDQITMLKRLDRA